MNNNESHIQIVVDTTRYGDDSYRSGAYIHAHHCNPQVQAAMYAAGAEGAGLIANGHSNALALEAAQRHSLGVYSERERRQLNRW